MLLALVRGSVTACSAPSLVDLHGPASAGTAVNSSGGQEADPSDGPGISDGAPEDPGRVGHLGHQVGPSTVWEFPNAAGIDPAPRRSGPSWRQFLSAQARAIIACDLLTVTRSVPTRNPRRPAVDAAPGHHHRPGARADAVRRVYEAFDFSDITPQEPDLIVQMSVWLRRRGAATS
jgi:hypothetical protein